MKGEEVGMKERASEGQGILYRIVRGLFSDSNGGGFDGFEPLLEGSSAGWGLRFPLTTILKRGDKAVRDRIEEEYQCLFLFRRCALVSCETIEE